MRAMGVERTTSDDDDDMSKYQAGVKSLCEKGITRVPMKYIWPESERPIMVNSESLGHHDQTKHISNNNDLIITLPIIDFAELRGPNRHRVIRALAKACHEYGFFELINHGVEEDIVDKMSGVCEEFFELPLDERSKYMSNDIQSPVRYGTSFNQNNDKVFCWRDFLKLSCHPLSEVLHHWPSSPPQLREAGMNFAKKTKTLYLMLMEAIMESLGLDINEKDGSVPFEDGNQIIMINCYPLCPEPELTLGMPPHSDYGFLTLLLQDEVEGLQIQHGGRWITVEPRPNSFVVNVGDHLEIFSNGIYKSVLHRVKVNSSKSRISIASLHSLSLNCMVSPSPKLIDNANPKRYKDTDLSSFLEYLISSSDHKNKNFLESRKLTC